MAAEAVERAKVHPATLCQTTQSVQAQRKVRERERAATTPMPHPDSTDLSLKHVSSTCFETGV